jgi:hypothetical protein
MRCQIACPHNKKFHQMDKPVDFSEAETSIILQKNSKEKIPLTLAKKLSDLNLEEYYPLLRRNLSVLMNK